MKISLIITTKNEGRGITNLLSSIAQQTQRPDEVVITVAGSKQNYPSTSLGMTIRYIELSENSNRSVGRNRAIEAANYEHILITDAGCRPDKYWVEKMSEGFKTAEVIAGVTHAETQTIFEKCVAPYTLVMPDKIHTKNFLPATRSMGVTKSLWKKMGGFNEDYRYAEDYEFARRLKQKNVFIAVETQAIVYWRPRSDLFSFIKMIYEHAFGDAHNRIWRPKVWSLFLRYIFFALLTGVSTVLPVFAFFVFQVIVTYLVFSVAKNYRYVHHWKAFFYLPLLQIVSDFAVMIGTTQGILGGNYYVSR